MTKKSALVENAQRMYVKENRTIVDIAQTICVHERTIRRWKEKYNWDLQRKEFHWSKAMFHEDLYNFARKMMSSLEYDMDNNNKIDPSRMYTFTKMLPLIDKIRSYEEALTVKPNDENKSKTISPEVIRQINEEILGIKYDDDGNML